MIRFKSLTGKMTGMLIFGLIIGTISGFFLYFTSNYFLDQYFESSGYLYKVSQQTIEQLQLYVSENQLSAVDTDELREWAKQENISYFTISRKRMLLYDNTYSGSIPLDDTASEQLHYSWQHFHTVTFADGKADVFIYQKEDVKFYLAADIISVITGAVICLIIFLLGVRHEVQYICQLNKEVREIENGCLDIEFTITGKDELADLATGLNQMRLTLLEKEEKEKHMKQAQDKLVLGMAHDLRTPLTSLMAYIEIIKKQTRENATLLYSEKAFNKTIEIRNLSEQLFEFFLINTERLPELESPENAEYSLGDYFSELCASLKSNGFRVVVDNLMWKPVLIRISSDYMGRIINNILSNINKYANQQNDIEFSSTYHSDQIGITIKNSKMEDNETVTGTGIGVKNIYTMMEQMKGRCEINDFERSYSITLWFPIELSKKQTETPGSRNPI